jgi:hypothetical protein
VRRIEPGSVVLSDPGSSFRVMAVAPVYVVGDYKVWNAKTSDNRTEERLADVNLFFDSAADDADRIAVLAREDVDYLLLDVEDARWLTAEPTRAAAWLDALQRSLDAVPGMQDYDGGSVARLIRRNPDAFELVAVDPRARTAALPQTEPGADTDACHSYGLWRVRATTKAGS